MPKTVAAHMAALAAIAVATAVPPAMTPARAATQPTGQAERLVLTRITNAFDDGPANGNSFSPDISSNGRFVVFLSHATNLVAGDSGSNGQTRLFVHDHLLSTTTRVDVGSCVSSLSPSISDDGLTIAFAADVCDGRSGDGQVYVHDRRRGKTTLVSADAQGNPGRSLSYVPRIIGDGRVILFWSLADLTGCCGRPNSGFWLYSHDIDSGKTAIESLLPSGQPTGAEHSVWRVPASRDGRLVAFRRYNFASARTDFYVRDRLLGVTTPEGDTAGFRDLDMALTGDGRFLLWWSEVAFAQVVVHDRLTNETRIGGRAPFNDFLYRLEVNDDLSIAWLAGFNRGVPLFSFFVYDIHTNERFEVPSSGANASRVAGQTFVFARDEGIIGQLYVATLACVPPGPPRDLSTSVTGGLVRLSWLPPVGAGVTTYEIEAGSATGLANLATLQTSATSYQTVAPPGTYFVRVRGQNGCGLSVPSNEVVITVG